MPVSDQKKPDIATTLYDVISGCKYVAVKNIMRDEIEHKENKMKIITTYITRVAVVGRVVYFGFEREYTIYNDIDTIQTTNLNNFKITILDEKEMPTTEFDIIISKKPENYFIHSMCKTP